MLKRFWKKIQRSQQYFRHWKSRKIWPEGSIVYYAGSIYGWTPQDLAVGLGGSELAALSLAREWVKMGKSVTIFNDCGKDAGVYEGVIYRPYGEFNPFDWFDTLIIWRYPWWLQPRTRAKRTWLDLHEVLQPEQVGKNQLRAFDKVFVKSQYHRELLPELSDDQIVIVSNGCDRAFLDLFETKKQPYRLIYASNYMRGLERMLEWGWPIIRAAVPEAELYVFYGWSKPKSDAKSIAWREKMTRLLAQPGIIEGGRIGVETLLKMKAQSTIHYYGCTFQEIDCISVRESALVGCVPVTSQMGALSEKPYCRAVVGDPFSRETHVAIAEQIVALLNDPQQLETYRTEAKFLAMGETWDHIAAKWLFYLDAP